MIKMLARNNSSHNQYKNQDMHYQFQFSDNLVNSGIKETSFMSIKKISPTYDIYIFGFRVKV